MNERTTTEPRLSSSSLLLLRQRREGRNSRATHAQNDALPSQVVRRKRHAQNVCGRRAISRLPSFSASFLYVLPWWSCLCGCARDGDAYRILRVCYVTTTPRVRASSLVCGALACRTDDCEPDVRYTRNLFPDSYDGRRARRTGPQKRCSGWHGARNARRANLVRSIAYAWRRHRRCCARHLYFSYVVTNSLCNAAASEMCVAK